MKYAVNLLFTFILCTPIATKAQLLSGSQSATNSTPDTQTDTSQIYTYVQWMPKPEYDYAKFLNDNLVYPQTPLEEPMEHVTVKFVVMETGQIAHAKIVRGISPEYDAAAVKVVEAMPPWKPGRQNHKNVRTYFTLPITFTRH